MQLLIVDDSKIERMILKEMLQSEGYAVQEAENGKQALEMALLSCPDMIISDILMPVMDGFKLCREIRADSRTCDIPFVFYTGTYTKAEDEEFAFKMGADLFLTKSTEWPDFFRELRNVIKEKEMGGTVLLEHPSNDENEIYKLYNERLIKKLEDKVKELEQEVSWRKKLEKQLYESQESLQMAIEGANLGMWDWNVQSGETKFNEKWAQFLGYSLEELLPHVSTWEKLLHPDDVEKTMAALNANLNGTTELYDNEHRLKDKAGNWRWFLARGKVISRDETGRALRHVGTEHDITDRVEAKKALEESHAKMEKQVEIRTADLLKSNHQLEDEILLRNKIEIVLRESEEQFRMLAENAQEVIYRMSLPDGIYEYMSPAIKEIFGYTPQECYQNPLIIRQMLHPDWVDSFDKKWVELIEGKLLPAYEFKIIHKSGEERWVQFRNILIRDSNENPIAIEGIGTDITGLKQAEMALAKQNEHLDEQVADRTSKLQVVREALEIEKERYQQIFRTVPVGIFHYNLDSVITECNPTTYKIFGFSDESAIGLNMIENFNNDDMVDAINKSLSGRTGRFQGSYTSIISGKTSLIKASLVPYFSADKKITGGVGVVEDMSVQVKASEALEKSEKKYRTILESIEDGYFEVDLKGNLVFFNKALADILGYPASELKGKKYQSFMDSEYAQKTYQKFNQVFKSGKSGKEFDWKIIKKNGDSRYLDALVAPIVDSKEYTTGFRGVVRDVSERRLMQQFLVESEERFRLIVEAAPVGIFNYDKNGIIQACNQAYVDINGSSYGKLIGFSLLESLTNTMVLDAVKKSLAGARGHYEGEYTSVTSGRNLYINSEFVPVFSENDTLSGGMCVVEDITERKKAEEALRKSEKEAGVLLNATTDAAVLLDTDGTIININDAYARRFHLKQDEMLGKCVWDLFEKKVADVRKAKIKQVFETCQPLSMIDERDGVWNYTNIFPVLDAVGNVSRVAVFAQDITERKLAEAKLKKSEEKYRNLFQHSNDAIFVHTLDGKIIGVNSAACRLTGYDKDAFLELKVQDLHPKDFVTGAVKEIEILKEKGWVRFESKFIRSDSKIIDVDIGARIVDPKNGIVQGIVRDITDRVMAKQALHDSEEKYRGLAERSPIIIILIKKGGRPYYVSSSVQNVLGFLPEELVGKLIGDFMSKEDESRVSSLMEQILNGENVDSFEVSMLKKDGTSTIIEWTLIPVKKGDEIDGFQAIGRDITEKKIAEDALRKSRKQMRELSKHLQNSREQERAGIAREIHDDLGQSLTAIKMDAAWLKSKIPEDRIELHTKAEDTIFLVDSAIQTVKRISSELRPGLLDDLGLSAAIEWQAKEYQKRSGINIYVTIEPEEIVVEADLSIAIFRVCQETLTNVARHARATDAWVTLTKNSHALQLEVRDNGCGISDKEMFKKNSFGLLGMRERVHGIGGKISITRIRKGGTKVVVTVPLGGIN